MKTLTIIFLLVISLTSFGQFRRIHIDTSAYSRESIKQKINNDMIAGSTLIAFSGLGYYNTTGAKKSLGVNDPHYKASAILTSGLVGLGIYFISRAINLNIKSRKVRRFRKVINYNNN